MSINQWKMINHIRDQLLKSIPDKTSALITINKEWFNIIKKLPATITFTEENSKKVNNLLKSVTVLEIPKVLNDWKQKVGEKAIPEAYEKPDWKTKRNTISNLSVNARTNYILSLITKSEVESNRLKQLEDLLEHFYQYPEGVPAAIKAGAISKLLRVRKNNYSKVEIQEVIRELLAVLGYVNPLPGQGIRILAIDGGGIRGLLVMEMLAKLEDLTGKKINELFDYICGVSTGSVITCTIGASGKSIEEISALYRDLSNKIFNQNVFFGARSLIWNHGYYDTALWEKLLKEYVGDKPLIKTARNLPYPKIGAISVVSNKDQIVPFIFRNYELPYRVKSKYLGSYKHLLWEAARASAAAPTYFEEFCLGEYLHQDGGMLVNNPTAVALHEAKQLWPNSPIQCVVSFGTGRIEPLSTDSTNAKKQTAKQTSWKEKFYNILVSATDTEGVHMILNDLLPPSVYFRFNPFVTEMLSMDECHPEKLELLKNDALMYIRRNEDKFKEAAAALLRKKTIYQKAVDWLGEKAVEYRSSRYN